MIFVRLSSEQSNLETAISYLLIVGVITSLSLEVIGIITFYDSYGHLDISEESSMLVKGQNFFSFIYELFQGRHVQGNGILLMIVGMVILILTPYTRVIASVLFFAWQRDVKYVLITFFVLVVLTISLALH